MTTTEETIVRSITLKLGVRAIYQGRIRFLCPHGIGYKNRKDGDRVMQIIAYQYDGETSKGSVKTGGGHKENWRCMDIAQFSQIDIIDDGEWYSSDNHSMPSSCIDEYIAQVNH